MLWVFRSLGSSARPRIRWSAVDFSYSSQNT
jgi:hypothetical protein